MTVSEAAEEFFAQWVHRNLVTLRSWEFPTSPAWSLAPHAEKAADTLGPALADIERSVVQTDDPAVFRAPGPWHAALYCQMLQYKYSPSGSRLLFRGQRNYSWELTPTILRKPDTVTDETRNELFVAILSAMSFNTVYSLHPASTESVFLTMSKEAYLAAAQHYGMNTYFLDFTTDPDAAVKFAAADKDSDDGMASILILTLESAEEHNLSVILPPPFVRRLYLQRGLFVEAKHTLSKEDLKIREVRFPYQPSKRSPKPASFEVLREGGAPVDILPESIALNGVIRATDETLAKGLTAGDFDEVERVAWTLKPDFIAVNSDPQKTWYEYVDTFEGMLHALAYNIDAHNQRSLDLERFARVVATNLVVSCSVASLYRAVPLQFPGAFDQERVDRMSAMADFIDVTAAKHGYDHAAAAEQYRKHQGLP